MLIECKNIKMEYISQVEPTGIYSIGSIIARLDNKKSVQDIIEIMDEIRTKHQSDLIYLGNMPCHYNPGWYKDTIRIKNKIYLGCWPSRIIQVDKDNDNLFEVEIIYDREDI